MCNKERASLDKLDKLIVFGRSNLDQININPDEELKLQVLYQMVGVAHNYTEAILFLAKEEKAEAGEVLIRSVLEGLITTMYVLEENTDIRAIEFILDDEIYRKKFATSWMKFIKKNPSYEKEIPELSTLEECKEFIQERQNNIQSVKKQYGKNLKQFPDLRCRAEKVDAAVGKNDLECYYLTVYRYLSGLAHLSASGTKGFIKQEGNRYFIKSESNPLDIKRLSEVAYVFYLWFLGQLSLHFGTPTEKELKPFEDIIKKTNLEQSFE